MICESTPVFLRSRQLMRLEISALMSMVMRSSNGVMTPTNLRLYKTHKCLSMTTEK